jgi:hypothetical protein
MAESQRERGQVEPATAKPDDAPATEAMPVAAPMPCPSRPPCISQELSLSLVAVVRELRVRSTRTSLTV